jgi:hypothetical protein
MRSISRKALGAAAVAVVGAVGLGAGLAGAADSDSGGSPSDVQLIQADPSTTVPGDAPDDNGARDRHCDHEGKGSGDGDAPGTSSQDNSPANFQASYRRGAPTSLRWG